MEKRDIYKVVTTATWEGEADDVADANAKSDAYNIAHLDEANHQVTHTEIWIES